MSRNIGDTLDYDGKAAIVTGVNDDGTVQLRVFASDANPAVDADRHLANVQLDDDQGEPGEPAGPDTAEPATQPDPAGYGQGQSGFAEPGH